MSHWTTLNLRIRDLSSLAVAANHLGLVLNRDQRVAHGYRDRDCDHAVSFENGSGYEMALIAEPDGTFRMEADLGMPYSDGGLQRTVGPDGGLLMQQYGLAVAEHWHHEQGHITERHPLADGRIQLRAVEPEQAWQSGGGAW